MSEIKNRLSQKKVLQDVLYAQCWEDPRIDRQAFQIRPDDVIFSITSGGCNILTFLIDNPKQVIALDINPCQNYLLDFKMASFKALSYLEMLRLLGIIPDDHRILLYQKIRPELQPESRQYWDVRENKIRAGIIHCGRYESYMRLLRHWVSRLMGRDLIEQFFLAQGPAERTALYREKWDNFRWHLFTRILLSRRMMTWLFDGAFFAQLEDSISFAEHFRQTVKRGLIEHATRDNYFMAYILLGHYYSLNHLPHYLSYKNFITIRGRLNRVQIVSEPCESYFKSLPDNSISKFNFTNIFEWMPASAFENLLKETIRVGKDGAILTYRNLLVPRSRPAALKSWIHTDNEKSRILYKKDRSFIYNAYIVEQLSKETAPCRTVPRHVQKEAGLMTS